MYVHMGVYLNIEDIYIYVYICIYISMYASYVYIFTYK